MREEHGTQQGAGLRRAVDRHGGRGVGYNRRVRRRWIFAAGFAFGYYLGARAGRERYEQIRKALDAIPFGRAVGKVQAVVELGVERLRPHREAPAGAPYDSSR